MSTPVSPPVNQQAHPAHLVNARMVMLQGDSGGPLIYKSDGKDYLLGIVSSGKGCAVKEFPGLYTDLRNERMRTFIAKTTGLKL